MNSELQLLETPYKSFGITISYCDSRNNLQNNLVSKTLLLLKDVKNSTLYST